MRLNITLARTATGLRDLKAEDLKAAEYIFRTHYGYFPKIEDSAKMIPIIEFVYDEWKEFWRRKTVGLRAEFFHDLLEKNLEAVKKEGSYEPNA